MVSGGGVVYRRSVEEVGVVVMDQKGVFVVIPACCGERRGIRDSLT